MNSANISFKNTGIIVGHFIHIY